MTALGQLDLAGATGVHAYLADQSSPTTGDDLYYAEGGQARSEWLTPPGAPAIVGPVTGDQFTNALAGRHPTTATMVLAERSAAGRRITAWSGLFAAPPEVTLLVHHGRGVALPDGRDVGQVASRLWEEAVDEAFAGLTARLGTRAGHAGEMRMDAAGWWIARFWHHTNRDGWLHEHVHYILPNCVQGTDGTWRTVDSRRFVREQKLLGAELHAALRRRFSSELGVVYDTARAKDGITPAVGLDRRYVDARSSRHRAIRHYLQEHGAALDARGLTARRQELYAERATRKAKDTTRNLSQLVDHEQARLRGLNLDPQVLVRNLLGVSRNLDQPTSEVARRALFDRLAGPDGLTEHAAVFNKRDLLIATLPHAADRAGAVDLARQFLDGWAIPTEPPPGGDPDITWYTTIGYHAAHHQLTAAWHTLTAAPLTQPPAADPSPRPWPLTTGHPPTGEQAAAYQTLAGAAAGVVTGPPGSGKTSVVAAALTAHARHNGERVYGTAVALNAAAGLALDCNLAPDEYGTLASLLHRARRPGALTGTLVIVDEASMLGTRSAALLVTAIVRDHARLLLVGDPDQAPPVEAGHALHHLTGQPATVHARLTAHVRQADPAERATVDLLRRRHVNEAIAAWNMRGRVTIGGHDATLHAIATTAAGQIGDGRDVLVLTATRHDAADLAARIRSHLHDLGHLGQHGHHRYGLLELTVGDHVILRRNRYPLSARNGARGHITATTPTSATVRLADGQTLDLPADYLASHVEWAYATNVHPAQGQTADHTHVLVTPALNRPLALVAGSRHRHTIAWHISAGTTLEHLRGPLHPVTLQEACRWMSTEPGTSDPSLRRDAPGVAPKSEPLNARSFGRS